MEGAVDAAPALAELVADGGDVRRVGDVELEHVGLGGELAGGALGERQPAPGAGEDHLGALLLREAGDAEREGGVGEDAGDEDALAVEEGHGPETATPRRLLRRAARTPMRREPRRYGVADAHRDPWWHRSGGQRAGGPAGVGRLRDGDRLAVAVPRPGGRRRAQGAVGRAASSPSTPADNEGAADADLVVIATPWDGATQTAQQVEGHLRGKVVISMANALTRIGKEFQPLVPPAGLGGGERAGGAAAEPGGGRPSTTCRPRSSATSTTRSRATC